jgi:alpha-2-macroglobulin
MLRLRRIGLSLALTLVSVVSGSAQSPALTIVNTGPQGQLADLAQANEIRIVFSEPMVTLGRIPSPVTASFVRIEPAIPGTYRWSGTTILIFTPDPKRPLPYATSYDVTVDTTATAVSGRRLARPETFRFTTPTVRLRSTTWYRRGGTVDGAMVVLLRFNQPVKPQDVTAHLTASLERHEWNPPSFTSEEQTRLRALDPTAATAFATKVAATQAVAAGGGVVTLRTTTNWDRQRFPPSPDLVALETTTVVKPESWVKLVLDRVLPSPAGPATPGELQTYTIQVERAFFIDDFDCTATCDGDASNPLHMSAPVKVADFAAALRAIDITGADQPVRKLTTPRPRPDFWPDADEALTLEDAGYAAQPPDRKYVVTAPASLKSADGQTLGYSWLGIVENWHMRAFTSFGDGHGVWEKDGGPQLPFYARNLLTLTQWVSPLSTSELMPRLRQLQGSNFKIPPPGDGETRRLSVTPDRVQSHGLDISRALRPGGTGLLWAAVREGDLLPRTRSYRTEPATHASVIQVTNLGITVKDSPQNTLVFVTRLDTGAPVPGAAVSIVRRDDSTFWRGTTGADGVAIAPDTGLRDGEDWYNLAFVVIAA